MNLERFLPLTETTYYILLALLQPAHGYAIMQHIESLSDGWVRIATGTLYGAIENLLKWGMIELRNPSTDTRRKVYRITHSGRQILLLDCERMERLV